MKKTMLFAFILIMNFGFSQDTLKTVVIDSSNNEPIEFVDVFNSMDHTFSNEDGEILFTSNNDSITMSRLGYFTLKTTFVDLGGKDTIYLRKNIYELNEVVVSNLNEQYARSLKSLAKNYASSSFKEKFFLRSLLRRNGKIIGLQDMFGKIEHSKGLAHGMENFNSGKSYRIEVSNMRKARLDKVDDISIELFDFQQLLSSLSFIKNNPNELYLDQYVIDNTPYVRLDFKSKSNTSKNNYSGYYVVDSDDDSFSEYYMTRTMADSKFFKAKGVRFRTVFFDAIVNFKRIDTAKKYVINKAKLTAKLEVLDEDINKKVVYEVSYVMNFYDHFSDFEFKRNTSATKDIFKIKHAYDASFWKKQQLLVLTNEMKKFIEGTKALGDNGLEVISNIDFEE